jgi:DUF4097 and DUF4098 domain-containing protein YvlB
MRRRTVSARASAIAIALAAIVALTADHASAAEFARDEAVRMENKTVAIKGTPTVAIDNQNGTLRIKTHQRPEVRIDAVFRVSAESRDVANDFVAGMHLDVTEAGSRITVRTTIPDSSLRRFRNLGFVIDVDVLMPATLPLEARNRFGDTSVSGLNAGARIDNGNGLLTATDGRGAYRLENRFGDIDALRLQGDVTVVSANGSILADTIGGSLSASNRFGDVDAKGVQKDVVIDNANGSITLTTVRGGARVTTQFGAVTALSVQGGLQVSSANGSIRASDIDGASVLKTTFGAVIVDRIRGPVTIQSQNGEVRGSGIGGDVTVTNTFGGVRLRDVSGKLDVRNQNGTIAVGASAKTGVCREVYLTTTFGGIDVYLAGGDYDLTARTAFGKIRTDIPILTRGTVGTDTLTGTIGKGGCALQLVGRNGNVSIQPGAGPDVDL